MKPIRKSARAACLALALAFAAPACLAWEVSISQESIERALAEKSSSEKALAGGLFKARLSEPPSIDLGRAYPGRALVRAKPVFSIGHKEFPASCAAVFTLRYDQASRAFLAEPSEILEISAPGLPPEWQGAAKSLAMEALRAKLSKTPVYALDQSQSAQAAAARYLLKSVKIAPGAVVADLSPF